MALRRTPAVLVAVKHEVLDIGLTEMFLGQDRSCYLPFWVACEKCPKAPIALVVAQAFSPPGHKTSGSIKRVNLAPPLSKAFLLDGSVDVIDHAIREPARVEIIYCQGHIAKHGQDSL